MVRVSDMTLASKEIGNGYGGRRSSQDGRYMNVACLGEGLVEGKQGT